MTVKGLISVLIFTLILFLSAGKAFYLQGWIFFATGFCTTLMHTFAFPKDSELMDERARIKEGSKSWDKKLLGLSALVYLINIVVAGLDSGRFHWSQNLGWVFYVPGILFMISGQIIFLTALRENKFFSSVVRIQKDRGHTVCDTGIYKIVRHPGYLGMIMSLLGIPFITGSIWSFIPTSVAVALLILRTSLEDKTLKDELEGYMKYVEKTPKKLIPWVW